MRALTVRLGRAGGADRLLEGGNRRIVGSARGIDERAPAGGQRRRAPPRPPRRADAAPARLGRRRRQRRGGCRRGRSPRPSRSGGRSPASTSPRRRRSAPLRRFRAGGGSPSSPAARQCATSAYSTPWLPIDEQPLAAVLPDQPAGLGEARRVDDVDGDDLGAFAARSASARVTPARASGRGSRRGRSAAPSASPRWTRTSASSIGVVGWRDTVGWRSRR